MKVFDKFYIYFIFEDSLSIAKEAKNIIPFLSESIPRMFNITPNKIEIINFENEKIYCSFYDDMGFDFRLNYRIKINQTLFSNKLKTDYVPLAELNIEYKPQSSKQLVIYMNLINESTGEILQRHFK